MSIANKKIAEVSRYKSVSQEKSGGVTYTPKLLADFVARQMIEAAGKLPDTGSLRILDPALGHGELIASLLEHLAERCGLRMEVYGFDIDSKALHRASRQLGLRFPNVSFHFESGSFLDFVLEHFGTDGPESLFRSAIPEAYDFIIANPPYVRTQIMGAKQAQILANQFGLTGRLDLYHAFILGMSQVLKPHGIAGIIVSNRFMTTKSGASIRQALLHRLSIRHVWDLGDTRLFDAAVLPAVLVVEGKNSHKQQQTPGFTTIYQTTSSPNGEAADPVMALSHEGVIEIADGRRFQVQHGTLNTSNPPDGVWRMATASVDAWLATVETRSWGTFRDIGKIRVGVKTCADKVFIRNDWQDMSASDRPELLKPLTTHHIARRFKPLVSDQPSYILYPQEVVQGQRRAVDIQKFPRSFAYLEKHRSTLERRSYVIESGRKWYELWVPQNPDAWSQPKLVFRDIAVQPTFWIDLNGSVVNGDCYWLISEKNSQTDLLWLACAVGNSTFIEKFYDLRFQNKLYAGRRRFITQYVEKFPLPDPNSLLGREIIDKSKRIYEYAALPEGETLQKELDNLVWLALADGKPI